MPVCKLGTAGHVSGGFGGADDDPCELTLFVKEQSLWHIINESEYKCWHIHCGVKVTEFSTYKHQYPLSLSRLSMMAGI
jgi:hypothetical protein